MVANSQLPVLMHENIYAGNKVNIIFINSFAIYFDILCFEYFTTDFRH